LKTYFSSTSSPIPFGQQNHLMQKVFSVRKFKKVNFDLKLMQSRIMLAIGLCEQIDPD
jgi:hypothetical protein